MKELEEIDYKIVVKVMKDNYKVVKPYLGQTALDTLVNELELDLLVIGQDLRLLACT